jgi:hypothetical protein
VDARRDKPLSRRWLMLTAGVVLAVKVSGAIFMTHSKGPVDALARDAIGDHWNGALKNRKVRTPVPLEQAAHRFDSVYRVLLTALPDGISTPHGPRASSTAIPARSGRADSDMSSCNTAGTWCRFSSRRTMNDREV